MSKVDYQQLIKEKTAAFIKDAELPADDNKSIIANCLSLLRQKFIYLAQYEKTETPESFIEHITLWSLEPLSKAYSSYADTLADAYSKIGKLDIACKRMNEIAWIQKLLHASPKCRKSLLKVGVSLQEPDESVIFKAISDHSSRFTEFICVTLRSINDGVEEKYQKKVFSYSALMDAMRVKHLPDRTDINPNTLIMLDLARNTMLAACKQSHSRCVNHLLDLISLCYRSMESAGYEELTLGVPAAVLEDVSLVNSVVHDLAIYATYLPAGCSEQEIKDCHVQTSELMLKLLLAIEAECTAGIPYLSDRYKIVKRSEMIAGLFQASPATSTLEQKEVQLQPKISFNEQLILIPKVESFGSKVDYKQLIKEKTAVFIMDLTLPDDDNKDKILNCLVWLRCQFIYLMQHEANAESFMQHMKLLSLQPECESYSRYANIMGNTYIKIGRFDIACEVMEVIKDIKGVVDAGAESRKNLLEIGISLYESEDRSVFKAMSYHSSRFIDLIFETLQSINDGVEKKYQKKVFSYYALVDAMYAKHFPDRAGINPNTLIMLDLARDTMLAACTQSRSRCVNHLLDLIHLCYMQNHAAEYYNLKLGVSEVVLEDVKLINGVVHDLALYATYLPVGCSEQEIKDCHAQTSALMLKLLLAIEAECTADLTYLSDSYKVTNRWEKLSGLFQVTPDPSMPKQEKEEDKTKVYFAC